MKKLEMTVQQIFHQYLLEDMEERETHEVTNPPKKTFFDLEFDKLEKKRKDDNIARVTQEQIEF